MNPRHAARSYHPLYRDRLNLPADPLERLVEVADDITRCAMGHLVSPDMLTVLAEAIGPARTALPVPPLTLTDQIKQADGDVIDRFTGEHAYLSNFAFSPVRWGGRKWRTVEHPFQAAKTVHPVERHSIYLAESPGAAKRLGRQVTLRPDWEQVKVAVMADLVARKFQDRDYARLLLATGDALLIEGNTWGDRVWGATLTGGQWVGENWLGRILMDVRRQLTVEWI